MVRSGPSRLALLRLRKTPVPALRPAGRLGARMSVVVVVAAFVSGVLGGVGLALLYASLNREDED